jgi:hypothetical protein
MVKDNSDNTSFLGGVLCFQPAEDIYSNANTDNEECCRKRRKLHHEREPWHFRQAMKEAELSRLYDGIWQKVPKD